jgi:CheY-like chemotaxis protein
LAIGDALGFLPLFTMTMRPVSGKHGDDDGRCIENGQGCFAEAGVNGFDVMKVLVRKGTHPPVVVITGRDEPGNKDHVLGLGASAYLTKPVDETSLLEAIENSLLGETPLN